MRRIVRARFSNRNNRHFPPVVAPALTILKQITSPVLPAFGAISSKSSTPAPLHAAWIVRLIGHPCHIEKNLRDRKAGPALRESGRAWRNAPIVKRILAA